MLSESAWERIAEMRDEQEAPFLEAFLFGLTIAVRAILDDSRDGQTTIQALATVNEITHRALNRIQSIRWGDSIHSREATWRLIGEHVRSAPSIGGHVGGALRNALARCDSTDPHE